MNYYEEIKTELINNEITKRVKDYSKNKSDLNQKYNVRYLYDMRKLYLFSKVHPLDAQLTI